MKAISHPYVLFFFAAFLFVGCSPATLQAPTTQHTIDSISELSEIWALNNVFITQESFGPITGATTGKFCFLGNLSNQAELKVICLSSTSGDALWEQVSNNASSAFAISQKGVFLGSSGIADIVRYNLDGKYIWDESFTGNGVIRIYVVDNEVQVFNHPEKLRIFDVETGELKKKIEGDTIFIATETEKFIYTYNLQSIETNTGKTKWETDISGPMRMSPLFTQDIIFVRDGEIMGRTYAISRATGKTLWKTNNNIISNIAYSPEKERIYLLTRGGELLSIDQNSGVASILIQFTNTPFILNGEQQVGGYEVAYDDSTNIVFVTLGDSRQLFAFQEK